MNISADQINNIKKACISFLMEKKSSGWGFKTFFFSTQHTRYVLIEKIGTCFDNLHHDQTSEHWITLFKTLMQARINLYAETGKTESTFGDALKAVHLCLWKILNPQNSPDDTISGIMLVSEAEKESYKALCNPSSLWIKAESQTKEYENVKKAQRARVSASALGNEELLNRYPIREDGTAVLTVYPSALYSLDSKDDRVAMWIESLTTSVEMILTPLHTQQKDDWTYVSACSPNANVK